MGIDPDVIAVMADRRSRTDLDAGVATDLFVAAMGAQLILVGEKFRFFEFADQLRQFQRIVELARRIGARR